MGSAAAMTSASNAARSHHSATTPWTMHGPVHAEPESGAAFASASEEDGARTHASSNPGIARTRASRSKSDATAAGVSTESPSSPAAPVAVRIAEAHASAGPNAALAASRWRMMVVSCGSQSSSVSVLTSRRCSPAAQANTANRLAAITAERRGEGGAGEGGRTKGSGTTRPRRAPRGRLDEWGGAKDDGRGAHLAGAGGRRPRSTTPWRASAPSKAPRAHPSTPSRRAGGPGRATGD